MEECKTQNFLLQISKKFLIKMVSRLQILRQGILDQTSTMLLNSSLDLSLRGARKTSSLLKLTTFRTLSTRMLANRLSTVKIMNKIKMRITIYSLMKMKLSEISSKFSRTKFCQDLMRSTLLDTYWSIDPNPLISMAKRWLSSFLVL